MTVKSEIESHKKELETLPTEEVIEGVSRRMRMRRELRKQIEEDYFIGGHSFREFSIEERKKLIDLIFGGKDANGKRYGIYVKLMEGKPRRYRFEAYGKLGIIDGSLESRSGKFSSFPDSEMFGHDDKDSGVIETIADLVKEAGSKGEKEVGVKKEHMLSQCHAYYGKCLH